MHVVAKASLFVLALMAQSRNFVASAKSSSSLFGGNGVKFSEREGPVKCTVILIEPYMVDPDEDETSTVACMLFPEYEGDSISGITYELYVPSFPHKFFGDVEYSTTDLTISSALIKKVGAGREHGGGIIIMKDGAKATKEFRGNGNGVLGLRGSSSPGRRLAQTMGSSSLIVLYAEPLDASNTHRTPTQLANDIFGINVTEIRDTLNARSQMLSCSRGKLSYVPACATTEQACSSNTNQSIWFKNGVLRVPIPYNVTGIASGTVKNWVEAEAQKILQAQSPKIDLYSFTQIMNVIPDAADWGGAAAWAYLPGQTSAFRSSYSFVMGVQVHEFGHNIGLHHSGFGTQEYADHSCMLGNPSYGDDGPAICFNGAKSWETGWYANDSAVVVPSSTIPFTADLIGAADWSVGNYTPGNHTVVLQITDSNVTQKFHIMYNRAKGPNAGVTFAKDKVTVTLGLPRQVSWQQAALGPVNAAGNVYPLFRKEKFNGGNKSLVIKLCSTTSGSPDIARVMVYLDDGPALNNGFMCPGELPCVNDAGCNDFISCTTNTCLNNTCLPVPSTEIGCTSSPTTSRPTSSPSTRKPTNAPTNKPTTSKPTSNPTTSNPTTRTPTNHPTSTPSVQPSSAPSGSPTTSPTVLSPPTESPTTESPMTSLPTESPTNAPSSSPTESPTSAPTTLFPTESPTNAPSSSPTGSLMTSLPTESPTNAPSSSPTESPTRAPTTLFPTKSPTNVPSSSPTANPTSAPTTKFPTGFPTKSPSNAPSSKPTTRAPTTRAPTSAPTTRAPTTKPPTRIPTSGKPATSVPTKKPK